MKKLFVVSKTHLDLGFTDFAETIRRTYMDSFIPGAIRLAQQVNTAEKKSFVWTTGSWILKEALKYGTAEQRASLEKAIQNGDIVPHAMPFTTHTELLDAETLEYGLSIVDGLDRLRGRKTVAAKMTDVPGHTKGLVPMLAAHGIKLLHIGVNGASALPDVPPCFLWKNGGSEVVVIYSGDYGGAFQCGYMDEILYFDHTLDNHGAPSAEKVLLKLEKIAAQYPGYTVEAGCLDDFAEILWMQRDKLPVIENEIGDTWIHGSAADPYKSAALRELMEKKRRWLADGTLQRDSTEYTELSDALLCIAEHTCGMDVKMYLADFEHYLKKDFQKARNTDTVKMHHPLRDFPQNVLTLQNRMRGRYHKGSYKKIEASWAEQRQYIEKALSVLSEPHRAEACAALAALRPAVPLENPAQGDAFAPVAAGDWVLQLNEAGGVRTLSYRGDSVIRENQAPVAEYRVFDDRDYSYWLSHYSRDLEHTFSWAIADFARPLLKYVRGKYPAGRFAYHVDRSSVLENEDSKTLLVDLTCAEVLCRELGAPRKIQVLYRLTASGLHVEFSWFEKDANRLTEAMFLHVFPADGVLKLQKLGTEIDPQTVISGGSRNLHAVQAVTLQTGKGTYCFQNHHAPLLSVGRGKILEFDNRFENFQTDGMTYVLHDNVWGTNFPLWYEDNARFCFDIIRL